MHYVKHFDILGVETAQIPCIELQGVPNTATEGAVGLLGINMLSEDHELYVCVAVKGNVYTWMPLKDGKDGVSVVKTELNDDGELIITLSNGTQTNLGVIKGEKGDPGEKGEQADLTKIKEKNKGKHIGFWLGDTETYENLEATEEDTWYLFEDDMTLEELETAFDEVETKIGEVGLVVETFDSRIKAVEDLIPGLENHINTNLENMRSLIPLTYYVDITGSGFSSYDVVTIPNNKSYTDFLKGYFRAVGKGSIPYEKVGDLGYVNDYTICLPNGTMVANPNNVKITRSNWKMQGGQSIEAIYYETLIESIGEFEYHEAFMCRDTVNKIFKILSFTTSEI